MQKYQVNRPMEIRKTRNKEELFSFLSQNKGLYLYLIGDLDDFFWPDTTWWAVYSDNKIESVALLYTGMSPATFLLFHDGDTGYPAELVKAVQHELPKEFNVHFSPGILETLGREKIIKNYGQNFRMVLTGKPKPVKDDNIRRLTKNELVIIEKFYSESYPDNWFDARMLETGKYFGYFDSGVLAGIAGIHVYSPFYSIAALGNIATHPQFRGRKIAYKLTSHLCADLVKDTGTIGLNVSSENMAAIRCYQNCGFEIVGLYDECLVRNI